MVSITEVSARVVTSPIGRSSATSLRSLRMILPERVFGSSATTKIVLGLAIAPISLATCSRRIFEVSASDP